MQSSLRPWVTAGIAVASASLIAVTPVTPPSPGAQHRPFHLTSFEEFDLSQLLSTTESNFAGLQTVLSSSNWLTNPDILQGLSTLFSNLGSSNPVTNPFSLLIEGSLLLLSGNYADNAASTAATAVWDNIQAALSSGDFSAALTSLENAPTTILYGFLNGYPTTVGSQLFSPQFGLLTNTTNDAATGSINALQQVSNTLADQVSAIGGGNLMTGPLPLLSGNLDLSININQIFSDLGLTSGGPLTLNQLLTDLGVSSTANVLPPITIGDVLSAFGFSDTSTIPIENISIPITQILMDLGITNPSGNATLTVPPFAITLGEVFSLFGINPSAPIVIGSFPLVGNVTVTLNQVLGLLGFSTSSSTTITPPPLTLPIDTILHTLGITDTSGNLSLTVPPITFGEILNTLGLSDTSTIPLPPVSIDNILNTLGINPNEDIFSLLGISNPLTLSPTIDLTGNSIPTFYEALSQDLLAVLGSFAPLSSGLPSLLTPDPTLNIEPLLSSLLSGLGLPEAITGGTLTADLTNIVAELLPNLIPS